MLPLLRDCLPVFNKICGTAMTFVFLFVRVTLIKIAKTQLDRSAALVLSVINPMYCSCSGIRQIRLEIWPRPDLAGFPKNDRIMDLLELKSGTILMLMMMMSFGPILYTAFDKKF